MARVYRLRETIYKDAQKTGSGAAYVSPLDAISEVYILEANGRDVGTFSVCRYGGFQRAHGSFKHLGDEAANAIEGEPRGMYVYFLGINRSERSASALKFVFGEIFKTLVRSNLETIFVLADRRLAKRYKWIGFKSIGVRHQGIFPKSGPLELMSTRQIRLGVYGLHADPIRWNIYLRQPIAVLRDEGAIPKTGVNHWVYRLFSLFSALALLGERAISFALSEQSLLPRKHKIGRSSYVR